MTKRVDLIDQTEVDLIDLQNSDGSDARNLALDLDF